MKLVSWNVNGLRACVQKGFLDVFREIDADIFCLQETKMQAGQLELELDGYYQYWNYAVKKGYSGTAIFTKKEPISVSYGLDIARFVHGVPFEVAILRHFLSFKLLSVHDKLHFVAV